MFNQNDESVEMITWCRESINDLENVNFITIKYSIRPSTIREAGNGIFIDENIPKGTFFVLNNDDFKFINDLAYKENKEYQIDDIKINTNIIAIVKFFCFSYQFICWKAIKDINKTEELSRVYGQEFWRNYDFWKKQENCKWRITGLDKDLPNDYYEIDTIKTGLSCNRFYSLYAKKINNKYYYKTYISEYRNNRVEKTKIDLSLENNIEMPFNQKLKINEFCGYYYRIKYLEHLKSNS